MLGAKEQALLRAVMNNDIEAVESLLKEGVQYCDANERGETAFTMACWQGRAPIVKLLLQLPNIQTNHREVGGYSGLFLASEKGMCA